MPDSTPDPTPIPPPGSREGTPTKEDLLKLPRWARIALATRCARRMQPTLEVLVGGDAGKLADFERQVSLAEDSARNGRSNIDLKVSPTSPIVQASKGFDAERFSVRDAAMLAGRFTAAAAADADAVVSFESGAAAIAASIRGGASPSYDVTFPFAWNARREYEALAALAASERWTDDTPVDPDRLGPLWPAAGEHLRVEDDAKAGTSAVGHGSVTVSPGSPARLWVDFSARVDRQDVARFVREALGPGPGFTHQWRKRPSDGHESVLIVIDETHESVVHEVVSAVLHRFPAIVSATVGPLPPSKPIDLYFDLAEFDAAEIAEALAGLSAVYTEMTGDELIIEDCGVLDLSQCLAPAGGEL